MNVEQIFFLDEPIPLELHHKNGNHRDSDYKNLALICINCHSQSNTFAGRNLKKRSPITDDVLFQALQKSRSINQALISLELPPALAYYDRANKIIIERNITHLRKDDEYITQIALPFIIDYLLHNEHWDLYELSSQTNLSIESIRAINNGTYKFSPSEVDYPIRDLPVGLNIAKYCSCGNLLRDSRASICANCLKVIKNPENTRANFPTKEELKALIRSKTFCEIGVIFNVSENTIRKWCKRYKLPYKRSFISQMTDKEWDEIESFDEKLFLQEHKELDNNILVNEYQKCHSYSKVAKHYGCSYKKVKRACEKAGVPQYCQVYMNCPVVMCDKTKKPIKTFKSISDAAKWIHDKGHFHSSESDIRTDIRARLKCEHKRYGRSAYGYYWRIANEEA